MHGKEEKVFEEEFPSLKQETICPFRNGKQFVDIKAIQDNCLDKQRVKDILTKASELDINDDRILCLEPLEYLVNYHLVKQ